MNPKGKAIIFSAPSGAGKTTLVRYLLNLDLPLAFSISACSRAPRGAEKDGVDYHFLGVEGFKEKIAADEFLEWEEVYPDKFYGTLSSEVERIWSENNAVLFDVDVIGGLNLKKKLGDRALAIFVKPPSLEVLELRLKSRATENEAQRQERLNKAKEELQYESEFDVSILNNDLDEAIVDTERVIKDFLME